MSATCYGYLCEFYPYLSHLCRFVTHTAKILLYYIHLKYLFYFAKTQKKYFFNSTHKMQKNYALSHAQTHVPNQLGDSWGQLCSLLLSYLSLSRNFYLLLSILKLLCFIFLPWLGQSWGNDQKLGIWKSIPSIWCSCLLIRAISYFLEVTTYNQTTTLGEWYQPSAWWKLTLIIANNFAVCLLLLYYQNSDRNAELFFIYFIFFEDTALGNCND